MVFEGTSSRVGSWDFSASSWQRDKLNTAKAQWLHQDIHPTVTHIYVLISVWKTTSILTRECIRKCFGGCENAIIDWAATL